MSVSVAKVPTTSLALLITSRLQAEGLRATCPMDLGYGLVLAPVLWFPISVPYEEAEAARKVIEVEGWGKWLV